MTTDVFSSGLAIGIGIATAVVGILILLGVLVILVLAGRNDTDARGMRPFSSYLMAVSWVAIVVGYIGSVMVASSLVQLIGSHPYSIRDSTARGVVIGGIIMLLGLGTLTYHLRRGLRIARGDGRPDGPSAKVLHSYVSAVAFAFVVVAVVAFGFAVYCVFGLAGPGVFGNSAPRTGLWRQLVLTGYVVIASLAIVGFHLRWGPPDLSPGLRRVGGRGRPSAPVTSPVPGPAPTTVTSTAMPSGAPTAPPEASPSQF